MNKKDYKGLKAELVHFGENDLNTTIEVPTGYSGCKLGTVEIYVDPPNGDEPRESWIGIRCFDDDENEYVFNWVLFKNRV